MVIVSVRKYLRQIRLLATDQSHLLFQQYLDPVFQLILKFRQPILMPRYMRILSRIKMENIYLIFMTSPYHRNV